MTNEELKQWIDDNLYHLKNGKKKLNSHLNRDSWWTRRGFDDIKKEIYDKTSFISSDFGLIIRIRCIINDIKSHPQCKICSNLVTYYRGDFGKYCSRSCLSKDIYTNPFADPEVLEKMKLTYRKNVGKFPFEKDSFQEKYSHQKPSEESIRKGQKTSIARYGYKYASMAHIAKSSYKLLEDASYLYCRHIEDKVPLYVIANDLGVNIGTVSNHMKKHGVPIKNHGKSWKEEEMIRFIESLGVKCYTRNTEIISPLELDIVIPEYNVAVEFCGIYFHSEKFVDNNYHVEKMNKTKKEGYQLITIFEDEWDHHQERLKIYLQYQLGLSPSQTLDASDLVVKGISISDANKFFETNHIQGYDAYNVCYGLFDGDILVSCMGIEKVSNRSFNIKRFCINRKVSGAFERLIATFVGEYQWDSILAYIDRRFDSGDVYIKNGFDLIESISPDYKFSRGLRTFHKNEFKNKHLSKKFDNYDPNLTEVENCRRNGYYRLFDCGLYKFQMINPDHTRN